MESWLPWLSPKSTSSPTCSTRRSRVVLVEAAAASRPGGRDPGRRGRAEREPGDDLGAAGGRRRRRDAEAAPRLRPAPAAHRRQGRLAVAVAESTRTVALQASGWPPVLGDSAGLARRFGELALRAPGRDLCGRPRERRTHGAVLDSEGLPCDLAPRPAAGPARRRDPPPGRPHRRRPLGSRGADRLFEARHRRRARRDRASPSAPPGAAAAAGRQKGSSTTWRPGTTSFTTSTVSPVSPAW